MSDTPKPTVRCGWCGEKCTWETSQVGGGGIWWCPNHGACLWPFPQPTEATVSTPTPKPTAHPNQGDTPTGDTDR